MLPSATEMPAGQPRGVVRGVGGFNSSIAIILKVSVEDAQIDDGSVRDYMYRRVPMLTADQPTAASDGQLQHRKT